MNRFAGDGENFELNCDAPRRCITEAGGQFGLHGPTDAQTAEDSVWHQLPAEWEPRKSWFYCQRCQERIPAFTVHEVTTSKCQEHYLFGQCPRCHAIYWRRQPDQ